jgi:carboxyl-terminal processing protease
MKLTTQKFYRISGDSTQYRGVVPDIILPDRQEASKFGERYLDYSLPWDSIGKVIYIPWPQGPATAGLLAHSRQRVDTDPDFMEIRRVAATLAERVDNSRQSLQIDTVWQERVGMDSGKSPHLEGLDDEAGKGGRQPGESEQARLARLVGEDPYTREALAILSDMLPGGVPERNFAGK